MSRASTIISQPQNRDELVKEREDRVRVTAYLRWLAKHGGQPVSDDETHRIWLEAERQVSIDEDEQR